jgi:hypothetical protein
MADANMAIYPIKKVIAIGSPLIILSRPARSAVNTVFIVFGFNEKMVYVLYKILRT